MQPATNDTTSEIPMTMPEAERIPIFTRTNLLYLAIILLVTIAALFPVLSSGFVEWEDPAQLLENETIKDFGSTWNWAAVRNIFMSDVNGSYNPLAQLSFAIEKYLAAPDPSAAPFVFHLTNLWMHMVCTVLVFVLFLKFGTGATGALIGSLLFGMHPMRVESVAWVAQRTDVLFGLFYIATLLCYLKYISTNRRKAAWYIAAIFLSLLCCFSNALAVTLPLSMIAIDAYLGRKWLSEKLIGLEKLPWWLMSFLFGIINIFFLRKGDFFIPATQITEYSFVDKMAVGAYSFGVYLVKWIYPYKMAHYYDYPAHLPVTAYVVFAALIPAMVLAFRWTRRQHFSFVGFGLVFFIVNIMFVLQIVPVGTAFMADRFTYIAYLGLFFILAKAYQTATSLKPNIHKLLLPIAGLYFGFLGITTYGQAKAWQSTESLCNNYIRNFPDSYYGYNQAGVYYLRESFKKPKTEDEALRHVRLSQNAFMEANTADSLNNRPLSLVTADIFQNLGVVYGLTGEKDLAIRYFSRALNIIPTNIEAIKNRAYQYFQDRKYELAIADYDNAIIIDNSNADLYYLRANCFYAAGDLSHAKVDLDKALSLNPNDPNSYIARSVIYRAIDNVTEARADAQRAKDLGANVPDQYLQ